MRNTLIVFIFLSCASLNTLYSQVHTYNRKLTAISDTLSEVIHSTTELNGRYYVIGTIYHPYSQIFISETDSMGNKLWVKSYGDPMHQLSTGFIQPAVSTIDDHIMVTGEWYNGHFPYTPRTLMVKFTPEGDTVWSGILNDSIDQEIYTRGRGLIQTSDHGFAVFGDAGIRGIIYKTNGEGKVQWRHYIDDVPGRNYSSVNSLNELPGKGYLASGTWNFLHPWDDKCNSMVYLLSTGGIKMWSDSIVNDHDMFSIFQNASGITTASGTPSSVNYPEANRMHLRRCTSEGVLVKERWYGDSETVYTLNDLIFLPDSTYLICGVKLYDTSFLFNFNSELDSLFYREYIYHSQVQANIRGNYIRSGITCADGDLFLGGNFDTLIASTLIPNGWIMKTDRYGCFNKFCDPFGIYILRQPEPVIAHLNDTILFAIAAKGDSLTYTWQRFTDSGWKLLSDTSIFKEREDTLMIVCREFPLGESRYRCRVNNSRYTVYSDDGLLLVTLGIDEQGHEVFFDIFPNPVTELLNIHAPMEMAGLMITNSSGQEVFPEYRINKNEAVIETGKLSSGVYFLQITAEGQTYFRKIIKK